MSYFHPLITSDVTGTIYEVLGEAIHEGHPKVFVRVRGAIGWSSHITHQNLAANFTAFPAPPHVHTEDCMCVLEPMEVEGAVECFYCGGHSDGPCGDRCEIARAEVMGRD